jgi:hypothetical protein
MLRACLIICRLASYDRLASRMSAIEDHVDVGSLTAVLVGGGKWGRIRPEGR